VVKLGIRRYSSNVLEMSLSIFAIYSTAFLNIVDNVEIYNI
jgi:hypothetical protein